MCIDNKTINKLRSLGQVLLLLILRYRRKWLGFACSISVILIIAHVKSLYIGS